MKRMEVSFVGALTRSYGEQNTCTSINRVIYGISRRYQSAYFLSKMTDLQEKFSTLSFGGFQKVYIHNSEIQKCKMEFAIYLPPQSKTQRLPVIYFLSGLTMDHVEFIEKSGIQRIASKYGVIVVAPDSSPRNTNTPGESEKWNIGVKASYYIDSTAQPWCKHYKMYSYLTKELPYLIQKHFPILPEKQSIMGHSIGGHGAFIIKMRNPNSFKSVSALSPVCNIAKAPHSIEGLKLYLGNEDNGNWDEWNATWLAKEYSGPPFHILIDQGSEDEYLKKHLFPEDFLKACQSSNIPVTFNLREGYTHNYYFVATFIEDHIKYHLGYLK